MCVHLVCVSMQNTFVFSDYLQCHFATCWFCLTLKLQGEMIGLTNALEVSLSYRLTACGQVSVRHPLPVQSPVTWELGSAATYIRIRNSMTIKRSVRTASTWHQLRLCWNELEGTFKAFQYRNQNIRQKISLRKIQMGGTQRKKGILCIIIGF